MYTLRTATEKLQYLSQIISILYIHLKNVKKGFAMFLGPEEGSALRPIFCIIIYTQRLDTVH